MTTRILLLDAGNSRLKWAVLDASDIQPHVAEGGLSDSHHWLDQGAIPYDDLTVAPAPWQKWGELEACYGVNVASDSARASVQSALANSGLEPVWSKSRAQSCGVKNGYQSPETLGADRWAALIAVRQRTLDASLVVSAGSALTVDALNAGGQFIGGIIVPGLHMMRQALAGSTAQVGSQYGKVLVFPTTTADAVETGLMAACTGAIKTMLSHLEKNGGAQPRIFLTGGDADKLKFWLPTASTVIPGLVLEGVYYITLEGKLA